MEDIREKIEDFIRNEFQIESDDTDFNHDVNLFDYGYVDSLGALSIITFVEKVFNIEITQKDLMMNSMNTINEIADFTSKKVGEKNE